MFLEGHLTHYLLNSDTGSQPVLPVQRKSSRGAGNWVASKIEADRSRALRRSDSPLISLGQASTSDVDLQAGVGPKTTIATVAESVCSVSDDGEHTCKTSVPVIDRGDTYKCASTTMDR